jgi:hypothetical protein
MRPLLVVAAVSIAMAGLGAAPAGAHSFTKNDGNDSPGKLDLRSVSVGHNSTGVVHTFRTWGSWTARSLGADSYFLVQIDRDHVANDSTYYEKCAFIYWDHGLRGLLSNCRARFLRTLPVAKLNGTTARVVIPRSEVAGAYWWAGVSIWDGPAPCRNGCVDFSPNFFPDLLHDLKPPDITMAGARLRIWQTSTTADFGFPFTVVDEHSGIASWTVQRHPFSSGVWTDVVSGGGPNGAKEPVINGTEGTRFFYRVVATDRQGNHKNGIQRKVYVPVDDANLDPASFSSPPTVQLDSDAFGGTYSEMAVGDVFTRSFSAADCLFELIGPGTGDWSVTVAIDGIEVPDPITAPGGGQRQTLYSDNTCGSVYTFTMDSGTGFAVDAVNG